jgi:hypothetical protein
MFPPFMDFQPARARAAVHEDASPNHSEDERTRGDADLFINLQANVT